MQRRRRRRTTVEVVGVSTMRILPPKASLYASKECRPPCAKAVVQTVLARDLMRH